jgi:hypothetical protein
MRTVRVTGLAGLVVWGLWAGFSSTPIAEAHLRDYLVSQPYYTARQGEFEVEFWNDVNFAESDNDDSYNSKHQIEFEYGLTDHLQLAYYEVYTWNRKQDWERDGFKVEAKLRFAEAGQWPVDLALYTEYKNPDGSRERRSDAMENKVILSKDVGPWNLIGNFVFEKDINTHSDWEFEYTAGVSYGMTPRTRIGLEVKETLGDTDAFGIHRKDHTLFLIPGLYTSLTPHLRVLVGPAFGLTRASDDVQLRSIVEVEF